MDALHKQKAAQYKKTAEVRMKEQSVLSLYIVVSAVAIISGLAAHFSMVPYFLYGKYMF